MSRVWLCGNGYSGAEFGNGERDVVTCMEQLKPKVFIPNHVTAVAVEGSSLEWKVGFFDALKARNFPQAGLQVDRRNHTYPVSREIPYLSHSSLIDRSPG